MDVIEKLSFAASLGLALLAFALVWTSFGTGTPEAEHTMLPAMGRSAAILAACAIMSLWSAWFGLRAKEARGGFLGGFAAAMLLFAGGMPLAAAHADARGVSARAQVAAEAARLLGKPGFFYEATGIMGDPDAEDDPFGRIESLKRSMLPTASVQ
jgi:hypothetical protein